MLKRFTHTLLLSLLFVGCIDENKIDIIVPFDLYMQRVNGGDSLCYPITIYSKEDRIKSVDISSSNIVDGKRSLLSVDTLSRKWVNFDYTYKAPKYGNSNVATILTIRAMDSSANVEILGLALLVVGGNDPLDNIENLKLYSTKSGQENTFSFVESRFFNSNDVEPDIIDIYEYVEIEEEVTPDIVIVTSTERRDNTDDKVDTDETLSREWRSMTGMLFARINSFDYRKASYNSVVDGYRIAVKRDRIDNIKAGDIIFVGSDEVTPLAVVKVISIQDNDGCVDDFYEISMKRTYLEREESDEESDLEM